MKQIPLSTCERNAYLSAIQSGIREDGREFLEVRDISLHFGKEYGSCTVSLGQTRVLAQVTCEVVEPRPSRPNEGKVSLFVHLSPMAAPHFEPGRGIEIVEEIQQILDRNIKESRCLDLESLCILAEESVWQFRVDVTVLNHEGNLADACNIAAVSALRHFHRPDVSVEEDGRVTIHTLEEREPIPTFMKKIPVCLTYAFILMEEKCHMLMDPSDIEERVMSGKLVVGLNPHGEITSLVFPGRVSLQKNQILKCIRNAFSKAKASAEMVQKAVEEDLEKRKSLVKSEGFTHTLTSDASYSKQKFVERTRNAQKYAFHIPKEEDGYEDKFDVPLEDETICDDDDGPSRPLEDETMSDDNSGPSTVLPETKLNMRRTFNNTRNIEMSSDSEEEETKIKLTAQDLQ